MCLVFTVCILLFTASCTSSCSGCSFCWVLFPALGASLGMGRDNLSLQSFLGPPSCWGLCVQALCGCQGKLPWFSGLLWCVPSSGMCMGTAQGNLSAPLVPSHCRIVFLTLLWFADPAFVKHIQESICMMLICH